VQAIQGVVSNLQQSAQTLQSSATSIQSEIATLQKAAAAGQPLDFTQINTVINDLVNATGQIVSVTTTISTTASAQ
jgi:prefoldin subunit 5